MNEKKLKEEKVILTSEREKRAFNFSILTSAKEEEREREKES